MSKIMRVFYDNAGLPYKDSALSVHYPILEGGEFVGANNTTDIYFYTTNLGDFYFVANCKLPNGALVDKLLVVGSDEFGTYYALSLDSELTEYKGHLKVALKGYGGNVAIEEETDGDTTIVVINGTPTIVATGIVDIAINYAPQVHHVSSLTPSEYEELLAIIGTKLNIVNGVYVIATKTDANLSLEGEIYYVKDEKTFYKVVSGAMVKEYFDCILDSTSDIGYLTSEQIAMLSNPQGYFIINGNIYTKVANRVYAQANIDTDNDGSSVTFTQRLVVVATVGGQEQYRAVILTLGEFYNTTQTDNKFLAKSSTESIVYGVDENGDQTLFPIDDLYDGNVVRRYASGQIQVPITPTANGHASSKQYADSKVSKVATANILYGRDDSSEVVYSIGDYEDNIPIRNENNTIYVPTPSADTDAANKKYVNDQIATALTSAIVYKDSLTVSELNALNKSTLKTGWLYNVEDNGTLTYNGNSLEVYAGDNVIWVEGSGWDKSTMDLSAYNETFMAAGFIQAGPIDSVPEELTFDSNGNITNDNWTGEIAIDYMSPPISDISISDVPATLHFDETQNYDNMITDADWTGIMTITY